jgi:hypothetical protein
VPVSGLDEAGLIRGRGLREIKGRLFYSAAWLDDRYPETGQVAPARILDPASGHRASARRRRSPHGRAT